MSIDRVDVGPAGGRIAELVALATETTNRLEKLWDEVGYSSCEKRRQMGGLLDGFRTLCENKEKQEQGVKAQFEASIADAKNRIRRDRGVLGQEHVEDSSAADMSLTDQLSHFESEASSLSEMITARREKFKKLSEEVVHMSMVLGDDAEDDFQEWKDLDSSLTDDRLQAFKDKKVELNKATEDRMQTVASIVRSIQELMEELQIPPSTPLDNRVLGSLAIPSAEGIPILQTTERTASSVGIDRAALDELTVRQKELRVQRDTRREKLEKMGEEILDLWQQLGISKDEQDKFALSVDGMGVQTLEHGEQELKRLRKLKVEKMGELMHTARERLQQLWDEMSFSDAERLAFKPMQVTEDGFTDELLQQHTQEAEALEAKLDTMRNILEKIDEREALVRQRMLMETSKKDPSRLLVKCSSVTERRQQQKMLKMELEAEQKVKNRLPVLTNALNKIIPQWESAQSSAFMYKGERYLDVLHRSEEEYAAFKDQIKAAKDAKKKEEFRKLAMASPAPKSTNSVALGRETPRSVRKMPGSSRKLPAKTPRTPGPARGASSRIQNGSSDAVTPDKDHAPPVPTDMQPEQPPQDADTIITDVSNQLEVSVGHAPKPRTSAGGKEDAENSSIGSPLEMFEGFDSCDP
ncbi:unnamed protein product [Sphacelaria rigidula]